MAVVDEGEVDLEVGVGVVDAVDSIEQLWQNSIATELGSMTCIKRLLQLRYANKSSDPSTTAIGAPIKFYMSDVKKSQHQLARASLQKLS